MLNEVKHLVSPRFFASLPRNDTCKKVGKLHNFLILEH